MRFSDPLFDRIWLWVVALAFIVLAPIWLILSVDRLGWRVVVIALYFAFIYRWSRRSAD